MGVTAMPASGQDAFAAGGRAALLQGGPSLGLSIHRDLGIEYSARVGVRVGRWTVDASGSTFQARFRLPPATHRAYEVLAGLAWHPGSSPVSPGMGFRAGFGSTPNAFGDRNSVLVVGPFGGVSLPLGDFLALRGEAGALVYLSGLGPGGPRGYFRIGLEARGR